jgi:streptomycin 6-kinase
MERWSASSRTEPWVRRWRLIPDGDAVTTDSSTLLPVRWREQTAMLKVAHIEEEQRGARQLAWWQGSGGAQVYACDDEAVLLERAVGHSLRHLFDEGRSDEATTIICGVAARLHALSRPPPTFLVPLQRWFQPLLEATPATAEQQEAARTASALLTGSVEPVPLHGDLHHDNVLDFGGGDWRAIDPKGLVGDRTFDLIHLLRNPDIHMSADLLDKRATQVSRESDVSTRHLLEWLVAFSGLSSIWAEAEGNSPDADLGLLKQALMLIAASR